MNIPDDPWLTLMLVSLLGLILFLRAKFPNASARVQVAVAMVAAVLFLSICTAFGTPAEASSRARAERIETRAILR
jgi:ABC-type siderophore export system fused ATPase/permease subunit